MNKIVLISIPGYEQNVFPLGLYSLKAYLLKWLKYRPPLTIDLLTLRTRVFERVNNSLYPKFDSKKIKTLIKKIIKQRPKIVGFSCYTWNIKIVLKIIKMIKQKRPLTNIVLGGPEASYYAKSFLENNPGIDFVVIDEGETTFTELIESLIYKKRSLDAIDGLAYRQGDQIKLKTEHPILNLATVPSPYLMGLVDLKKEKRVVVETSRGCPFKCAYCSYNIRGYAKIRYFPIDQAKKELEYVLTKNVQELHIIDDNFNLYEDRAIKLLKTIIKYHHQTSIKLFVRADVWRLSEKIVKLLKKSGALLLIGIQSLNEETLRIAKRTSKKEVLEHNLKMFDRYHVPYELEFIIGLPGDHYQDIKNNIDWALSYNLKRFSMQVLRINPDTFYQKNARRLGLKYMPSPPYQIYESVSLSRQEIKKAFRLSRAVDYFINEHPYKKIAQEACQRLNYSYSDFFAHWLKKQKLS